MDTTIRNKSLALTILIHGLLILLLFLFVISTPNPPFAEAGGGGGVLVSIGTVDAASGDVQATSEVTDIKPQQTEVQTPPPVQQDANLVTQDNEKTTEVDVKEPKKKEEKKPEVKPKVNVPVTPVKVEKKEPERQLNNNAIYKGPNKKGSDGNAKSGTGDQGNPNGDPTSPFYGKNGNGNGNDGGDGGGSGGGSGPGVGTGKGPGVSLNLSGRRWLRSPKIVDKSQETGKVVVDIIVDKSGKVISAIPGGVGSTTTSAYLYKLAKEAALATPFNASPDGRETQKGTITFNFVLE
ncbi:MAG: energy transducer TonB [Bacteroidia bacterium]